MIGLCTLGQIHMSSRKFAIGRLYCVSPVVFAKIQKTLSSVNIASELYKI